MTGVPRGTVKRLRVVAYDFGAKRNILRSLVHCGFDVTVVPAHARADEILALEPDAVFLSNGPGDPAAVVSAQQLIPDLVGRLPILGICYGQQTTAQQLGGSVEGGHAAEFGRAFVEIGVEGAEGGLVGHRASGWRGDLLRMQK